MKESKTTIVTGAILGVGAILLVVLALVGNSEEISYPETFEFDPAEHEAGAAVVTSKRVNEGMKFAGIVFREPEYRVNVAFTVPGQECFFALADQEKWPVTAAECSSEGSMRGTLSGTGTTIEGDTYIGVTVVVREECYSAVELGADWPPPSLPCA